MSTWQLQEAKGKFSEVVKQALSEGTQGITLRGEPVAVLELDTGRQPGSIRGNRRSAERTQ